MPSQIFAKSTLAGALGAITPFLMVSLFAGVLLPPSLEGLGEGLGILMTLACLPTICIGAISGGVLVWLLDEYEKPAWILRLMAQYAEHRVTYLIAYIVGFFAGPILGMLFVLLYLYSQ